MERVKRILKSNMIDIFESYIKDCDTVLDLGCGYKSPLEDLKEKKRYTVGVDAFRPYIEKSIKKGIHDDYFVMDILDVYKKFNSKSFDCIILMDVIEHLERIDVIRLLINIINISKKRIIVFTPNGFLQQNEYHNNIYQIHRSGWNVEDLRMMGFKIYGIRGLKWLRGELAKINHRPINLWRFISMISDKFVKHFPQFAFQLLCIKEVRKK